MRIYSGRPYELMGTPLLLFADDELIKVHVHSKAPGEVLNLALRYGEITQIHILNMREQHRDLLSTRFRYCSNA